MSVRTRLLQCALAASLGAMSTASQALNILITNDDGLTSNVKALYEALTAAGHDVIVSVPCTNQSGRSGAIVMYNFATVSAANDEQVNGSGGCRNKAALIGEPAFGPMTKAGFNNGDFHYVHGTPVMSAMYGLDVVAQNTWGKAPDLVLSGPNEGPNVGKLGTNSGTVGNVQVAAGRGLSAIALSAGSATKDDTNLANPSSPLIAQFTLQLVNALIAKAGSNGRLLPQGLALTVNFPENLTASMHFAFARMGSYDFITPLSFRPSNPGYGATANTTPPTAAQAQDEAAVYRDRISVAAMQVGFEQRPAGQEWLRLRLKDLLQ